MGHKQRREKYDTTTNRRRKYAEAAPSGYKNRRKTCTGCSILQAVLSASLGRAPCCRMSARMILAIAVVAHGAESSRRAPRHRRDVCLTAWCDGRVPAKRSDLHADRRHRRVHQIIGEAAKCREAHPRRRALSDRSIGHKSDWKKQVSGRSDKSGRAKLLVLALRVCLKPATRKRPNSREAPAVPCLTTSTPDDTTRRDLLR